MSSSTIARIARVLSRAPSSFRRRDRVEQLAMEREGAAREIGAVERLVPETLEGLAHLLQQLREQRIVGGVVDREMEGEVLAPGRALLVMHALPSRSSLRSMILEVLRGAAQRRQGACLNLEAAADVQRLQQRVAQVRGVDRERHVDGVGRDAAQQIGAAAPPQFDDAERLQLADHLAHGRAADRQRLHQLALGRQAVTGLQPRARDIAGQRAHHAFGAIGRRQRLQRERRLVHPSKASPRPPAPFPGGRLKVV